MSNLFKPTYTKADPETGKRITRRTRKWYGRYKDDDGVLRRVALCEDKTASQVKLVTLIREKEQKKVGLVDPASEELKRPIQEHLTEYKRHLVAKARSDSHITETIQMITNFTAECGLRVLADLHSGSDKLEEYLANGREGGASHRTVNAKLVAVRSFCRWLIRKNRMHEDPTSEFERLNEEEDRRLVRRALTNDEALRLIQTTYLSKRTYRHLTGRERSILYLVAQRTGLRRKELRSLTPQSIDLSGDTPTVSVHASQSKRRRQDTLPLSKDAAAALADLITTRKDDEPLWPGSWWRRSAEMLRLDLADAEIDAIDKDGRIVDFHGQRTTFITGLARAGVTPAMAQKLARHSDINLTLGTYTKLQAGELSGALGQLPNLSQSSEKDEANVATAVASAPENAVDDPRIETVIEVWDRLPEPLKQAVLAIVDSWEFEP